MLVHHRLAHTDLLAVEMSDSQPMKILFSNDDFVIVNKPANYLSVPSRFPDKDDRPVLGLILQKQLSTQIFPVHRLDYEVEGLMLFAKNAKAHTIANRWFENKQIEKTYVAVSSIDKAHEIVVGQQQEWKSKILRGKKRSYESPHGQLSLTLARLISQDGNLAIWNLQPVTGRAHQLRFDLARHGFPIVGDELYGSTLKYKKPGIALRAFHLKFPSEAAKFQLPPEFQISSDFQRQDVLES